MAKKLKATHEGQIELGDKKLNVAVLSDGTRLITQSAVFKAFGRTKRGRAKDDIRVLNRPAFLDAKNLQPFIDEGLDGVLNTIDYETKSGADSDGFNAEILPKMCKVYLDARENEVLLKQQLPLARASEVLLVALSKLGMIALVDEATGYQKEKDEYQRLVGMYIAEEMRPWIKTFSEQYYKDIYKLLGWDWSLFINGTYKNHPQIVGKITNDIVYNKLPEGVLNELERLNPKNLKGNRKHKHHQFLSESVGYRALIEHFGKLSVIASMYKEGEYKKAKAHIDQIIPDYRGGSQLQIEMPVTLDNYKDLTKEDLSDFDSTLKKALDYNP